jgi:EmrB/QacA subfamily drug resistance transporter
MDTTTEKEETAQATPPGSSGRSIHGFALFSLLAALLLTLLLEALDQTIVGTALPKIISQLQGFNSYTWVVTAYLLAYTTMIPIISKLSDQFGRKWFFICGVIIFMLGSMLSGAAQTMNQLIAFRALQGIGAGMGIALVYTVVGDIFPPAERARWQGIFAGVYGFSSVVGPTLGGWLTDHGPLLGNLVTNETRWRWVFYVNLPICILALIALFIYMPGKIATRSNRYSGWAAIRRIDFAGAILASAATICLLLGLTWGSDQIYNWNSIQVIGILVAAGILYILFFIVERFAVEAVMPLDLFRNRVFSADSLLALSSGMVLLSLVIYLPLYLQGIMGESATNSGEVITPMTVSLVIGATITGLVLARLGRYQMLTIIGAVVLTIGVFLMTQISTTTSLLYTTVAMVIAGIGLGMFFPVLTLVAQNALPRQRMGVGTGVITYLRSIGQTLGIAIVGTVVNHIISTDIVKFLPASAKQLPPQALQYATNTQALINPTYRDTIVKTATNDAQKAAVSQAIAKIPAGPHHDQSVATTTQQVSTQVAHNVQQVLTQVFSALKEALMGALTHGFWTILVFCIIGLIATFFLKDVPLAKHFKEEGSQNSQENAVTMPS